MPSLVSAAQWRLCRGLTSSLSEFLVLNCCFSTCAQDCVLCWVWHSIQDGGSGCVRRQCSIWAAAAAAKSQQSCPTLCDPIASSPTGSPVPVILQARTLEWVAISFSNAWKWKVKVKSLSHVRLFSTPWTIAYQAPPSMGFSRQEYWSGVPLPSPSIWAGSRATVPAPRETTPHLLRDP